jgi:hypothetical protein
MKINIEAERGDYLIKIRSDDADAFHDAIQGLKDFVDPSARRWQPATKSWRILPAGQLYVIDWLAVCRDQFGADVIWGKEKRREGRTAPKPEADPFAALYLLPSAPVEVVKAAYRALATMHHPDHGGDVEKMKAINAAYSEATRRLAA